MSRVLRIVGVAVVALCAMLGFFLLSGPTSAAPRCVVHCGPVSGAIPGTHIARTGVSGDTPSDGSSSDTTSAGYAGVALIGVAAIGFVLLTGSTLLLLAGRRHRVAA